MCEDKTQRGREGWPRWGAEEKQGAARCLSQLSNAKGGKKTSTWAEVQLLASVWKFIMLQGGEAEARGGEGRRGEEVWKGAKGGVSGRWELENSN